MGNTLLEIMNNSLETGQFLENLEETTLIPSHKYAGTYRTM